MRHVRRLISVVRNVVFRSKAERDLDEELQSYVALVADEQVQAGADAASAARAGRVAIGGVESTREAVRQHRAGSGFERLSQDVRYALRILRRTPGFTLVAIAVLSLGIGSNAVVFSVIDATILKPLPYRQPEQVVEISELVNEGTREETHFVGISWKDLDHWRQQSSIFSTVVATGRFRSAAIPEIPSTGPAYVGAVSPELLAMLDIKPLAGRWFTADEAASDQSVVLIWEPVWRRAFGSDPDILGRTVTLDQRPYSIVGVMPATFSFGVSNGPGTIGWTPYDERADRARPNSAGNRPLLRIRDGLALVQAERAAQTAAAQWKKPSADRTSRVELVPLDNRSTPGRVSVVHTSLGVLMGVVGCVLLIVCTNIANLLLERSFTRRREFAVRAAIGASRGRLVRQMMTEGFVLTAAGGVGGIAIAAAAVAKLPVLAPAQLGLFSANPMALDARVLGVSGVAVILTTVLCGVIPAIRASRANVLDALEGSAAIAGARTSGRRLRHGLQAVEVALTLVLITGLTLLSSSFVRMLTTPPGYNIDGLVSATVSLPKAAYPTPEIQRDFFNALMTHTKLLAGVQAATYGPPPPLGGAAHAFVAFGQENRTDTGGPSTSLYWTDDDYLRVLGIPLKEGRYLNADDAAGGTPVAIIDDDSARHLWPGQSAIGQRFRYSQYIPWITVVGVAGHVKTNAFTSRSGTAQAYMPIAQSTSTSGRTLLVRSGRDSVEVTSALRSLLHDMDPALELKTPAVVAGMYDDIFVTPRFDLIVMSLFAGLALVTAAVGLFGLLNYSVSQRTREIGVRLALGATAGGIRTLILRDALAPVATGLCLGLAGSFWLSRYLESLLFGVKPYDATAYAAASVLMLVVSALAVFLPARRATRVDPVTALRVS